MRSLAILGSFAFLAACASQLDNHEARDQIQRSEQMERYINRVELRPDFKQSALEQGLLRDDEGYLDLKVQPRLARHINSPKTRVANGGQGVAIDITIANKIEHENSTDVEFIWHYAELPELLRRFSYSGGNGTARFLNSDEGWLLQNVSMQYDLASRFELDEAELENVRKDIAAERNRKTELVQLEQQCRRETSAKFSKKLTNENSPPRTAMKSGHDTTLIELTDNYLVLHKVVPRVPKGISVTYRRTKFKEKQWLGDVAEFKHDRRDMKKKFSTKVIGQSDRYIARGHRNFVWGAEFFVFNEQTHKEAWELLERLNAAVRVWNQRCGNVPKKNRK